MVNISAIEHDAPHESQTNSEIVDTINRKGLGGFDPGSPNDGDDDYVLDEGGSPHNGGGGSGDGGGSGGGGGTPHIDDNEFQSLLQQRNHMNANPGTNNFHLSLAHYVRITKQG